MATKTKVVTHRIQRDSSGNLVLDDGGSPACKPRHYILIVVTNEDTSNHTVVLDPTDIRFKSSTLPKKNPTRQSAKATLTLEPGEGDVIKLHLRIEGDFDDSDTRKLPHGDYKYTLEVDGAVPNPSFDPGFNITPP